MGERKATVSKLEIEGVVFPPVAIPPGGSSNTLILAGAGVRGIEIGGKFIAFTAIGVYMEEGGVRSLSGKWKGKTVEELQGSLHFYNDIISGSFEKLTRVTMVLPLTGQQYSGKVVENCVSYLKATDNYTDAEASAVVDFIEAFNGETFPPGSSILFTHSPSGKLTIGFSKDGSVPEAGNAVIENKALSEALLESIIGEHGVSPEAKRSLAFRVAELLGTEEIISPGQKPVVAEIAPISA